MHAWERARRTCVGPWSTHRCRASAAAGTRCCGGACRLGSGSAGPAAPGCRGAAGRARAANAEVFNTVCACGPPGHGRQRVQGGAGPALAALPGGRLLRHRGVQVTAARPRGSAAAAACASAQAPAAPGPDGRPRREPCRRAARPCAPAMRLWQGRGLGESQAAHQLLTSGQ